MTAEEIKQTQKQYVLQSWNKQRGLNPIPIEHCDNIYLYDYEGNRYADMSSLHVNMNLGYGNQDINNAIKTKLERYAFISEAYADEDRAKLAKMIVELMPDNMGKVFFTNAGADANENAIKIARMYTGRNKIFSRYRSYHGSSFGAGNLTGEPRRFPLEPGVPGFIKLMDPYLYRDNLPFAVKPDIVTFAKGVTCGYIQLGGVCVSKDIAAYFDDHVLSCGLTYNGHPLACAAGVACVNYYLEHDIAGHVTQVGKVLGQLLEEMKAKHFMTFGHENMILVAPPLIITEEQLREELAKLDEVLGEVDKMIGG